MSVFKLITAASALVLVTACQTMPDRAEQTESFVPVATSTEAASTKDDDVSGKEEKSAKEDTSVKEEAKKEDPPTAIDSRVLYLLLTGETALQRHKYDVALEAYLEAAKRVKDPRVAEKAAQIGMYLENSPKTEKAVSLWLDKDDKNIAARQIALIDAVAHKNQPALIKHLNAILKNNPAAFQTTLLTIEKSLKKDEEVQFIVQTLNALEKQHPKQAMIFLTQSLLAVRQNNIELARQKVHQALLLQPGWEKAADFEAELQIYSGKLAFKNKQFAEAITWFDKVKQSSFMFDAALDAVAVLMEQEKYTDAAARLDKLLANEKEPKQRLQILLMQAELQNTQKNYSQAIDILTNALKEEPDSREILYARALTAEKANNLVLMEDDLQKILAQDPDDVMALNALGYALVDHAIRYDDAEVYLQRAMKLQPESPMIVDSYGWLQFKKGNFADALKYLQSAYDKMPENEITAHLAETLWALGKKQEAETLIKDALKKTPDDEFLLDFQQRVLNIAPADGQKQ